MNFTEALLLFFILNCLLFWLLTHFNLGPNLIEKKSQKISLVLRMILLSTFSTFLIFSILSAVICQRSTYWTYSAGITVVIIVICIFILQKNIVHLPALLLPLIVITLSLTINGPAPITSDEGRYAGFAYRIMQDGKWIPFKYPENTYYQFFHLLPSLNAILSIVAGIDPIYNTHPLLVFYLTVLTVITVYAIVEIMLMDIYYRKFGDLIFIILLATPPISSLALMPRNIAVVMYLLTLLLCLVSSNTRNGSPFHKVPIFLTGLVGVISHAIFPILVLTSFTSMLVLIRIYRVQSIQASVLKEVLKFVAVCSTLYWIQTLIMDQIIHAGKSMYDSFVDLLSGEIKPFGEASPWYASAPSELALSWTLLPALTTIFIAEELMYRNRKTSWRENYCTGIGFSGLLLLLYGFILRVAAAGFSSYFYYAYFLLVPPSIKLVSEIVQKHRLIPTAIMIGLVAISAFYGIQDPAYSPDIYKILLTGNKRSWITAETLSQYLSLHTEVIGGPIAGKKFYCDQRVAIGLSALMLKGSSPFKENILKEETLFVTGSDELGIRWAQIRLPTMKWDLFNKVFSDGLYNAYVIKKG